MPLTFVSGHAPSVHLHVFGRRPLEMWAILSICIAKFGAYATTLTIRDEPEPMTERGTPKADAYHDYLKDNGCLLAEYELEPMTERGTQKADAYHDYSKENGCPLAEYEHDQDVNSANQTQAYEEPKEKMTLEGTCRDHYEEDDEELSWLMQTPPDEAAWITSLRVLRGKFEEMTKARRAVVVDAVLRRLDWHSTNTRDGYLLGHMGGRTAMLTSLLVAAQEDTVLVQEFPVPPEVHGMWQEMEHFLEQHPGSHRSLGRGIGRDPPCIMLHCHEGPSITPIDSPIHEPLADHLMQTDENEAQRSTKRMRVMVEVSSGSCDVPQLAGVVEIPIQRNRGSLKVDFTLQGDDDVGESSTVPASPPSDHGGAVLSPPAPDGFGELGISLLDYWRLKEDWEAGRTTQEEMATTYGESTAQALQQSWALHRRPHAGQQMEPGQSTGESEADQGDEIAMISLGPLALLAWPTTCGAANEDEELMRVAKEHLHRQRGEGWTARQQASTLYYMIQHRGREEYANRFPEFLEALGLPCDVDMGARCLPGPTPFMHWLEAELWDIFVNSYEEEMGFETEGVMQMRDSPTMTIAERETWRRWAGINRRRARRSRSRTPQRTTERAEGQAQEEQEGDDLALMHRGDRPSPTRPSSRRRRGPRRAAERSRSRGRADSVRGAGNREERVRLRLTEETRWLVPRSCPPLLERRGDPSSSHREPRPPTTAPPPRDAGLDIIQASSEWLRVMGLRRPGQEDTEPANAMTRTAQQNARIMLRQQSEQGLIQMYRALMRVMGMLFIEATRILIDEHDERRRGGEMVDVTVDDEEDDESIYMQGHIRTSLQGTWAAQLQKLVEQVDSEGPRQKGVARALLRRIEQSLFLQSARGAQLQAALVAVVGPKVEEADTCDTYENDGDEVERWWSILK